LAQGLVQLLARIGKPRDLSRPTRYLTALLVVAAALGIAMLMRGVAGNRQLGVSNVFLAAVVFSSWYCGLGPGLVSVALGVAAFQYLFVPPEDSFKLLSFDDEIRTALFTVISLLVVGLSLSTRLANQELAKSRRELHDFLENGAIGLHWVGPDGQILWANRAELDMLGYSEEEYFGHHIAEFHVSRPIIDDILARLARGETLHDYPAQLRAKSGRILDVLINANVLWEEGHFLHTRTFTRDVTEEMNARRALIEADARLQAEHAEVQRLYEREAAARRDIEHAQKRTAVLQALAAALVEAATPEAIGETLMHEAVVNLEAEVGRFLLVDPENQVLLSVAQAGYDGGPMGDLPIDFDQSRLSLAVKQRRGIFVSSNLEQARLFPQLPASPQEAWATVPVIASDEPVAVMGFGWKGGRQFPPDDIDLMFAFARLAAQALERSRLYSAEMQSRRQAELATDRLTRLQRITMALAETMTQTQVADVILRDGGNVLGATSGLVALFDRASVELVLAARRGYSREAIKRERFGVGEDHPLAEAVRLGRPLFLRCPEETLRFTASGTPFQEGEASWAVVPIIHNEDALGVLQFAWTVPQVFDDSDVELMKTVARQTGQALERARLYQSEQGARREAEQSAFSLARLHASRSALASARTPAEVADVIVREGIAALQAKAGIVRLLTEDGVLLQTLAGLGFGDDFDERWRVVNANDDLPAAEAVRLKQPVYVDSPEAASRFSLLGEMQAGAGIEGMASVPLLVDERCFGSLTLWFSHYRTLDSDDKALIEAFANQGAQALDRARLYAAEQESRRAAEDAALRVSQLQRVTAALAEATTTEDVRHVFNTTGLDTTGAWAGTLYVLSPESQDLVALTTSGYHSMEPDAANLSFERFPQLRRLIDSSSPIFMLGEEALSDEVREMTARNGSRSRAWALLPLRHEQGTAGMIALSFEEQPEFDEAQREMLLTLGRLFGQALERARLYQSEMEARRLAEDAAGQLRLLQAVTSALSTAATRGDIEQVFLSQGVPAAGAWAGSLYLLSEDRSRLEAVASTESGPAQERSRLLEIRSLENVRAVAEGGEPRFIHNRGELTPAGREMSADDGGRSKAWALIPVVRKSAVIGMMVFSFDAEQAFEESHADLLLTLGRQFGEALDRARLYDAERLLRARINAVMSDVPGVVWEMWGAPGSDAQRMDFVSDYVEEMLGYSVEEWLATPNFWLSIMHPEDRERASAAFAEAFAGGGPGVSEFRWVRKDGRIIHVLAHSSVIKDADGNHVGMRGVTLDVTQQVRAEAALRESELRAQAVVETAANGIITLDSAGRIETLNPAAQRMFGYSLEEVQGQPLALLLPATASPDLQGLVTATGGPMTSSAGRRFDGSMFALELAVSEVRSEGIVGYTAIVNDVSERRRAERAIRFLVHASDVLSSSLDYETTLDSLARLSVPELGDYCAVDIIEGDEVRRLALVHEEGEKIELARTLDEKNAAQRNTEEFRTRLRELQPTLLTEIPDDAIESIRDEERRDLMRVLAPRSAIAVPLPGKDANFGMMTFVTAESGRHYDDQDLALATELGRRAGIAIENARLYLEAQRIEKELRRSNEAKDEFLGMVSHELRTPITTIYGGARFLHLRSAQVDEKTRDELIQTIETESEKLYRLIENLLAIARIDIGREIPTEPVLLGAIAERVAAPFRTHSGREVEVRNEAGSIMVSAEPTYIEQVVQNLLSNADKYSPPDAPIEVRVVAGKDDVSVAVRDRGQGVAAEELNLIFDSFYRSARTAGTAPGKGLGLTVCKRLIEAQKGRVWARNRKSGGLEVGFALPQLDHVMEEHSGENNGGGIHIAETEPAHA
jgi:PAS domain S-box-containing protein